MWPLAVGRYPAVVVTEPLFGEGEASTGWLIVLRLLTPGDETKAALNACIGWL